MLLGQREISIKIPNERVEADPELIGDFRGGVGRFEQLGYRVADRVGAQLDAVVGIVKAQDVTDATAEYSEFGRPDSIEVRHLAGILLEELL